MIIITSGVYLNPEFTSIFGLLPPSFLPVGNRRLFDWQARSFGDLPEAKVLTLPQDFKIPAQDQKTLDQLGIEVLRLPDGLSLGQAIVYVINVRCAVSEPIRILHGDTLCGPLHSVEEDVVLTGTTSDYYRWAECKTDDEGRLRIRETLLPGQIPRQVLCGYFTFSNGGALAQCLTAQGLDFIRGLDLYAQTHGLSKLESNEWLDFGHIQTYYRSKARLTTERAFNSLKATPLWIRKSSTDQAKIDAEASWFEALPPDIALFTPRYLGREDDSEVGLSYRLEYLYLSTLSELSVFGDLPTYSWHRIFALLDEFMQQLRSVRSSGESAVVSQQSYRYKTLARLEEFARSEGINLSAPTAFRGRALPSLERIAEAACGAIPDASFEDSALMHGDLCYSNIMFDFRSSQIRVIDPRGRTLDGKISPFGDSRYDLAKLSHSVVGRYDYITSGRYELRRNGPLNFDLTLPSGGSVDAVEQYYLDQTFAGCSPRNQSIQAMTITLFLSMLPLHYEDKRRQYALLANALRLFSDFSS